MMGGDYGEIYWGRYNNEIYMASDGVTTNYTN